MKHGQMSPNISQRLICRVIEGHAKVNTTLKGEYCLFYANNCNNLSEISKRRADLWSVVALWTLPKVPIHGQRPCIRPRPDYSSKEGYVQIQHVFGKNTKNMRIKCKRKCRKRYQKVPFSTSSFAFDSHVFGVLSKNMLIG